MRKVLIALAVAALALAVGGCDTTNKNLTPVSPSTPAKPVIVKFDADATRLGPPNGATLDTFIRWEAEGDLVRCRIDQVPGQPIGDVPTTGAVQVRPGVTTVYTMTCTNALGSASRSLTIIVG